MEQKVRTGRRIRRAGLAVAVGLLATVVVANQASAHDFSLSGSVDRDCGDDQPWSATVTATTAESLGSLWVTSVKIDDGEFGPVSERQPDSEPYVYEIGPFDASKADVSVTVNAIWYNQPGHTKRTSSITLQRPADETCPGPTLPTTVPPTTVTPTEPNADYDCVTDEIVVTGADDTDSVDYTIVVDIEPDGERTPWAVTITAAPKPGYDFPPDTTTEWTFTGEVTCDDRMEIPAPVQPTIVYDCELEEFVGADDTDQIDYTVTVDTAPDGFGSIWEVTVTAAPQPGFVFPSGATTEWQLAGQAECVEIISDPPFPTPVGSVPVEFDCETRQLVIIGADDTDQIDFTVTINAEPDGEGSVWDVTITAVAQPGFEFAEGATTEWNYTGTVRCQGSGAGIGPVVPDIAYDCETESFVGADDTDEIDYTITVDTAPGGSGSVWEVTVTATPQAGVTFPPGATTEWEFSGTVGCDDEVHIIPAPALPPLPTTNGGFPDQPVSAVIGFDCTQGRLRTFGTDDTEQVDFTVTVITEPTGEGSNWELTITAAPKPGFAFEAGSKTEWTYAGVVDCVQVESAAGDPTKASSPTPAADPEPADAPVEKRHPDTGAEHVVMVLIAMLLVLAGLACLRVARRDELAASIA